MECIPISNDEISHFENHLRLEEKSELTIQKCLRDVSAFINHIGSTAITKETVIAFKTSLIEQGYKVRSINSMIASINALFSFLEHPELKIKSLKLQQQVFCPEEKELSKAEFFRLCDAAKRKNNQRILLILQTICATGIRVSELKFFTVDAVRSGVVMVKSKGKIWDVFIVKALQKKLLRYIAEQKMNDGPIFITRTGNPICRTNIWREMKQLCEEAQVTPEKVYPHNLRHLFARIFYGIEKDIAKLADILGHSSINTTRIYIISTGAEHREKMENMHLII